MKGSKRSYQFLGNLMGPPLGFMGLSAGMKFFVVLTVIGCAGLAAVGGVTGWAYVTQSDGISQTHQDLVAFNVSLSNKILETNVTLCNKIMDVNATIQSELDVLVTVFEGDISVGLAELNDTLCTKIMAGDAALMQDILNLNGTANMTFFSQISMLNDSLCTKIMDLNSSLITNITAGDSELFTTIMTGHDALQTQIDVSISTINNVTGAPVTRNLNFVANGTGIQIQAHPLMSSIYLENTGIVTVNSVTSLSNSHDLLVTGIGMITVNSFPGNSTIEIDGSALSTAVVNLQMQNNMQQMEIAVLEGNVTSLQTEISNLQMMGNMIAQDLNGTTHTVNMTLMELLMEVMTLQSTVAALQSQVNSLSSGSVAPGTISPFGGTVVPTGYLLCDGTEYLQSSYPALYTVISTMYCGGTCSNMSTFRVPDLRGKVPAGQGGTAFAGTLGSSVGAETHTLTAAEMPMHAHGASSGNAGSHTHLNYFGKGMTVGVFGQFNGGSGNQWSYGDGSFAGGNYGYGSLEEGAGTPNWFVGDMYPSLDHSHTVTVGNAGSGGAHNNIQPSLIVKYIIKT